MSLSPSIRSVMPGRAGMSLPPPVVWLPTIAAGSGSDVYVERLAQGLRERGIRAEVTWFPHRYEFAPGLMARVRPPAGTTVIHANSNSGFPFRRFGLPLVVTEHHYVLDPAYRPYKSLAQELYHRLWIGPCLRRSYRAADVIVTPSRFTADVLRAAFPGLAPHPIPNWLDLAQFSPATPPAPPRGSRPFRLLFVGNASRRKGADVVLELAQRLGRDFEIRCTTGLRGSSGLQADNLRVLGRLSDAALVEAYREADAVLVTSRYEGFGYAALEAMACARPVVGFRCGAIAEVLGDDGAAALLADIDDVEGLEAHCRMLAASPELCARMGLAGRERALARFGEEAAIDAYLAVYAEAMARRLSGGPGGD